MSSNKSLDEIDLLQVFLKGIRIIKNNMIIIISCFLTGSLLGFLWYATVPKQFESKMLISSEILTESYSKELIDNLNSLIKENNQSELAKKLNLSENESIEISKIEIDNADDKPEVLKEKEKIFLLVTVTVKSLNILPNLQKKLTEYLENNNFVKTRVQQRKDFLMSMIKKIDVEIIGLEEFKNKIYKGDFLVSVKGAFVFDPTTVNSKIIDLTRQKIEYEHALQIVQSVQVVDGFTPFKTPTGPKLSISLASGSFVGLFFVAVLIAVKAIRKIMSLEKNGNS